MSIPPFASAPTSTALLTAMRRQSALLSLAASAQSRSSALAAANISNAAATAYQEAWVNNTAWTPTSATQVSGNKLCGNGQGASSGMTHGTISIPAFGSARIQTLVTVVTGQVSGSIILGVCTNAAGSTPTASGGSAIGLAFGAGGIQAWNLGAGATLVGFTAGTYMVTINVDATSISVVAVPVGSTSLEYRQLVARPSAGNSALALYLFNSDSRGLTGSYVGKYAYMLGPVQSASSFGVITQARTVVQTTIATLSSGVSANVKIETPTGYTGATAYPVVLMFHGNGGDQNRFTDNAGQLPAFQAFIAAGYICVSASPTAPSGSNWGSQADLDAYYAAWQYVRDNFNCGPVVFYANSMGGIISLITLAANRIPCAAWIGMSPTYNLVDNYTYRAGVNLDFHGIIDSSYFTTTGTISACDAGATSLTSTATYPAGTVLMLDAASGTAGLAEQVTVTSAPTGSGPYTIPITATLNAHNNGASVSNFPSQIIGNVASGSAAGTGPPNHDPSQLPAIAFRGVPMMILTASDDVSVYPAANGVALAAAVRPVALETAVYSGITGGHSFTITAAMTAAMTAFAAKYIGL